MVDTIIQSVKPQNNTLLNNSDQPNTVQSSVMSLYDTGNYIWLSEKEFKNKWEL